MNLSLYPELLPDAIVNKVFDPVLRFALTRRCKAVALCDDAVQPVTVALLVETGAAHGHNLSYDCADLADEKEGVIVVFTVLLLGLHGRVVGFDAAVCYAAVPVLLSLVSLDSHCCHRCLLHWCGK